MTFVTPHTLRRGLAALGIAAAASLPAHAGARDVEAVCPGLQAQLSEALADVHREWATPSQVDLHFAVQGDRIVDLAASGGPRRYQRAALRAARDLQCHTQGRQVLQLSLRFVDPQGEEALQTLQLAARSPATR